MFALGLLFGSLAQYINPNTLLLPSFFGLGFLPFLVINIIAVVFWLFAKTKYIWLSLLAMILSGSTIMNHFATSEEPVVNRDADLKVMSYNVRLFDLYNWSSNKKTRNLIFDYLVEEDADIICFQEFFNSNDKKYFNTLDTLIKLQKAIHVHDVYTSKMHKGVNQFGIATFSRFPIVNKQTIPLDTAGHNVAIFTDIKTDKGIVRVFNLHLASVHLSGMEKDINEHIDKQDQQQQLNDLRVMVSRLAGGFKRRASQAEVIEKIIADSPYPVIICSDLNDTPASYAYHSIKGNLKDAFLEKGNGLGTSYIGFIPSLRIDYILLDTNFAVSEFKLPNINLSDHKPVVAGLNFKTQR